MRLGCAHKDITPQIPVVLGGYSARENMARGVATPLLARAFIFEDGKTRLGLLTVDLLMLSSEQTKKVCQKAAQLIDLPEENIIIACSHTHSGPIMGDPTGLLGKSDSTYERWLLIALPGIFLQAADNLEEVRMGVSLRSVEGVSCNRRDSAQKVRSELAILAFARPSGEIKVVLLNYACHPTVLGADNLLITPDYPGAFLREVERFFSGATAGFINGAAGDISTRFSRREQSHREAERLGSILAGEAIAGIHRMEFLDVSSGRLRGGCRILPVDFKELLPTEEIENEIKEWEKRLTDIQKGKALPGEMRIVHTGLEGAYLQKKYVEIVDCLERKAELNFWQIGSAALVSIPGELFSSLGEIIRRESPFTPTLIACYSNGQIGYIPDKKAYLEGGYEALATPLLRGFGEKLTREVVAGLNLLQGL